MTTPFPLGRHVEHDPASRGFVRPGVVNRSSWRSRSIRIYDPRPNPAQPNGCCTTVAKCIQLNAAGNRKTGVVLNMDNAQEMYLWETGNDEFPGQMPEQDTGSSGLASAKTAIHFGQGGAYDWIFGGPDAVVQAIVDGDVVSVGTRWENDMFHPDAQHRIHLGGGIAGGHQWAARAYDLSRDLVGGRCWWGSTFRDFWIARTDLGTLLADQGDAHVQVRA